MQIETLGFWSTKESNYNIQSCGGMREDNVIKLRGNRKKIARRFNRFFCVDLRNLREKKRAIPILMTLCVRD